MPIEGRDEWLAAARRLAGSVPDRVLVPRDVGPRTGWTSRRDGADRHDGHAIGQPGDRCHRAVVEGDAGNVPGSLSSLIIADNFELP